MQIQCDDEELSTLEKMSDADLVRAVRDGVAKHRAAAKDDPSAFKGKPAGPDRPGASLGAQDRSTGASVEVMTRTIPGYQRLK
jgi:hypothetical protein